ncbi:MAG: 16S rRNA (uracil(1498)-N(3))-methyltransferase [Sedimenticolaceae bacterium]|nr:16S rRNA (uracil(1498)-N(3))-methyltransferase [Gammaproteobacteria bacterium]
MRLSRIHTTQALEPGGEVVLDERACRYLTQVLRLRTGQSIVLFNGDGRDCAAELTRCDRRGCSARIGEVLSTEPETALPIHLGIGISRGERMDFAIQKSVELGVQALTPLLTARSVVQLTSERRDKRMEHWRGVIVSACEQSGRSRVPMLHPPQALDEWLTAQRTGLMLYHKATNTLATAAPPDGALNLLIGPEGGLSEGERGRAIRSGFTDVRLGPRVLRTETAPLAALAAIQVLWGDFR